MALVYLEVVELSKPSDMDVFAGFDLCIAHQGRVVFIAKGHFGRMQ